MTTHRAIQLSNIQETVSSKAAMYRRCAGKAADIGNQSAAIFFVHQAQKCDRISQRCMSRLFPMEPA